MAVSLAGSPLYGALYGDAALEAIFSETSEVEAMIRFEAALARAQARLGVIPEGPGQRLAAALDAAAVAPEALAEGVASTGVPVPALVAALRAQIGEDAQHLHWGATSQDVIDTAHVLQLAAATVEIETRLTALIDALQTLSEAHAETVMAGRTRSQIATPITFGLRAAQWAQPLIAAEAELPGVRTRLLKIQFGGAAGNNAAVAHHGPAIGAEMARLLGLADAPPWHTDRSGLAGFAGSATRAATALSKMAGDAILMARSEIGELSLPGGGSSTMPQKSNPVGAEAIRTLAHFVHTLAAGLAAAGAHEEERDGVLWAAEWAHTPQMVIALGAALSHGCRLAAEMKPNAQRMRARIDEHPGIMAEAASFALAAHMPRAEAQAAVKTALAADAPFADALANIAPSHIDWSQTLSPEAAVEPSRIVANQIFASRRKEPG